MKSIIQGNNNEIHYKVIEIFLLTNYEKKIAIDQII